MPVASTYPAAPWAGKGYPGASPDGSPVYALSGFSASNYYRSATGVGFAGEADGFSFALLFYQPGTPTGLQVPAAVRDNPPTLGYNFQFVTTAYAAGASVPGLASSTSDPVAGYANGAVHLIVGTAGAGAGNLRFSRNGRPSLAGLGAGTYSPANANRRVAIGVDASATLPTSLHISAFATSAVQFSDAQIAQLWNDVRSAGDITAGIFPGAQNIWSVKQGARTLPANWVDSVSGAVVARTGTVALQTYINPVWGT